MSTVRQPNILLLLSDQHRFDWVGGAADRDVRTPHLDALAQSGMRFVNAHSPSPQCAPARACLATGRAYDECGVPSNRKSMPLESATYYQALRAAGYTVLGCGKFDLSKPDHDQGLDGSNHAEEWGFDHLLNCGGKGDAVLQWVRDEQPTEPYMNHLRHNGLDRVHAVDILGRGGISESLAVEYSRTDPTPLPPQFYEDNWIGESAITMLRSASSTAPWHMVVNFAGPHNPEDVTADMAESVAERKMDQPVGAVYPGALEHSARTHESIRRAYTAMVENIDDWVGRFVSELSGRGELDNTIIVYSSDHGEMLGDHGRWAKSVPYQASVRVPLVVSGPSVGHGSTDALVSLEDLAATFIDFAQAPRPREMTASSLSRVLAGEQSKVHDTVTSGLDHWRLVTDGRWKLVQGLDPDSPTMSAGDPRGESAPLILFDLLNDPSEDINVAADHPAEVERLAADLPHRSFEAAPVEDGAGGRRLHEHPAAVMVREFLARST